MRLSFKLPKLPGGKLILLPLLFMLWLQPASIPEASAQVEVSFAPSVDFPKGFSCLGSAPDSLSIRDLNGDGNLDLAVANPCSLTVSVLLGDGTGGFGPKSDFGSGDNPFTDPIALAIGDFNGDTNPDLAVANVNSSTVSILLGNGTGAFTPKIDFGTGISPLSVSATDFNGDGNLDLAIANSASNTVSILLGDGNGGFGPQTEFPTGLGPFSLAVGDLNGDGNLDLVTANFVSSTVSILLGDGTGVFGPKTDFVTDGIEFSTHSVAIGDLNSDSNLDLAVVNAGSNTVSILLGDGSGTFGSRTDFATGPIPTSVAIGDLNGDGNPDLTTANFGSNTVSVLLGDGTGAFGPNSDFVTGSGPISVRLGDVNGDGKLDLAVANLNTISVLLNTTNPVIPFDAFDARVEIDPADGEFEVKSTFTLGGGSNGIDAVTEIVQIELTGGTGSFFTTIPAGSFTFRPAKGNNPAQFRFEGVIDGVALEAKITDLGNGNFEFKAEGEGADLTGLANPVTAKLTIGNDGGSTMVEAEFE